jgi:hypothetical protein
MHPRMVQLLNLLHQVTRGQHGIESKRSCYRENTILKLSFDSTTCTSCDQVLLVEHLKGHETTNRKEGKK